MTMAKTILNVRVEESEMELLKHYCQQSGRTQTDVVRELIRSLGRKISDFTSK
ncbi:ribbon-helix-helix protein, CopG family [Baaleninema sp.]|uniref:ribbon-helix-helix protein, CopG family n=1 Tax=Baaleninema sp. TaxID=3101197 RepID=UPI003CFF5296